MSADNSSSQNGAAPNAAGTTPISDTTSGFSAAYDRRLAEIEAVKDDELVTLNIDVHAAVATVLGALPAIKEVQPAILGLPGIDQNLVTGLEDYAQAAGEANSRWVTATTPGQAIVLLNDSAMKMRETMRTDLAALVARGLIDKSRLSGFKGLVGYKNVGFELVDYANLFNACWATIQGKTALTVEEVQNAKSLGEQLVRAAGEREQGPAVVAATARIRQQALTLLKNAYDETQRGVTYLRWHMGDADTIAPSLVGGRNRKREEPAPTPEPPAPDPTPAPAPVVTPTNGQPAHAASGLPGAHPFGA